MITEAIALAVFVLAQGMFGVYLARTDRDWTDAEAIPGLDHAERDEFVDLTGRERLREAEQARLATLTAQVDSDLAGMGMSGEDVPALSRLGFA